MQWRCQGVGMGCAAGAMSDVCDDDHEMDVEPSSMLSIQCSWQAD